MFSGGIGLSAASIVVWLVALGLVVWQAVLTWMMLRDRSEVGDEAHRLGRLAAAVDELGERFETVARHSLAELDRRSPNRESEPVPCPGCQGTGWVVPESLGPEVGRGEVRFPPGVLGPHSHGAASGAAGCDPRLAGDLGIGSDPAARTPSAPRFSVVGRTPRPWARPEPFSGESPGSARSAGRVSR